MFLISGPRWPRSKMRRNWFRSIWCVWQCARHCILYQENRGFLANAVFGKSAILEFGHFLDFTVWGVWGDAEVLRPWEVLEWLDPMGPMGPHGPPMGFVERWGAETAAPWGRALCALDPGGSLGRGRQKPLHAPWVAFLSLLGLCPNSVALLPISYAICLCFA